MNQTHFQHSFGQWIVGVLCVTLIGGLGCRSSQKIKSLEYARYRNVAQTGICLNGSHLDATSDGIGWSPLEPTLPTLVKGQTTAQENENDGLSENRKSQSLVNQTGDSATLPSDTAAVQNSQLAVETNARTLSELIGLAIARNPEVDAARKDIELACSKIPQVASLADPMLEVVTWPIYPNVEQQAGGRMIADVAISQEFPWAGKRESRVGQATREVNRLQNKLHAAELKVANEVKQACINLWLANQQLEIAKKDQIFLENLFDQAESQYEAGRGGQQDLLRINAEIGVSKTDQSRLMSEEKIARAELVRVLSLEPDHSFEIAMESSDFLRVESLPDWESISAQALAANPELHSLWAEVQRDQWKATESRLNYYPDVTCSLGWGSMTTRRALAPTADGVDNLTAGVGFNLPVRIAARDAALRESEAQVVKGIRNWERERDQVLRDVRQMHTELQSLQERSLKYRQEIIPSIEQAVAVSSTAYEAREVDLGELILLRRELLRLKSATIDLQAQWHKLRANLSWLLAEVN
jgi:outer membrane protein, heavy metal efflux system